MMLFRSAHEGDIRPIHRLAEQSGIGMTTLPKNLALLKERIAWSDASFAKKITHPKSEYYLFVLEDTKTGDIVGTSAIESVAGHDAPFYSYKVSKRIRMCHSLKIRNEYEVLSLVNDNQGHSELCTLFLEPNYRHNNNGVLLARARFLFIAQFPNYFSPTVIAEMRGVSDEEGQSPFWDHVGKHFFHMSFAKADSLTLSTNKQFIADLMPRNPIYIKLLAPTAQAVIGKPHPSTLPAMNILLREGFRYNNYVDIFDAGPTLEAPRDQIQTIVKSHTFTLKSMMDDVSSPRYLLSNTKLHFCATIGHIIYNQEESTCILSHETAALLKVTPGDSIRVAPLQLSE